MEKKPQYPRKPDSGQAIMIRRRGWNPDDYLVVKDTYVSLYIKDRRTGAVKIIIKQN